MFFKMLINDLKAHKGLNIILFFCIISASIISVIASNLMYMEITGRQNTDRVCNVANMAVGINIGAGQPEKKEQILKDWMANCGLVKDGELKPYVRLFNCDFYANGMRASDSGFPSHKQFQLTTAAKRIGLLYNEKDRPFAVDTGCMAISLDLSDTAGIGVGDEIQITTQLGTIYAFRVSDIYKTAWNMSSEELIISDADFEKLKHDEPFRRWKMLLQTDRTVLTKNIDDSIRELDGVVSWFVYENSPKKDSTYMILTTVSYFLMGLSVAIILIMLITIRYMMLAAIRREEKEIGMMRAIGVDSLRYRWMFCATYICFAIIGGLAGVTGGAALAKYVLRRFCKNDVLTDPLMVEKIAFAVSLMLILLIIVFAAIVMRRIRKISVIEVIHGSNIGERFEKLNRLDLYRTAKGKVPNFLAVSDLVNGFAKYAFLIVSYMLAAFILLTVFNLNHTVLSKEYQRNQLQLELDLVVTFGGDLWDHYYQKGGSVEGAYKAFAEDANKEGIPLSIRYFNGTGATVVGGNGDGLEATFWFGDTENKDIPIRKGGKLPIRDNEILVSAATAQREGFKIGDEITLELEEYDDDRIGSHTVQRNFIICGLADLYENGEFTVIAGREYTGAVKSYTHITNYHLEAPESEHAAYIQKLKDRFGAENFRTTEEYLKKSYSYITMILDALKVVFTIISAFILLLNTTLYTTVDMAAETPDIALLKCSGFTDRDIRKWHMLRMTLILILAILLAYVAEYTAGNFIVAKIFGIFDATGVRLYSDPVECLVIIPVIIFGIGLSAMRICMLRVKSINIQNIRED